ncbi:secreted ookinete protein, putative [Plasmodium relictum]|uniref:Secreted ookinete protein, putative n=1 Tax=Plasmodium relictum TaxID=85471 RepID=A0A1J1HGD1_PLARL|nr:secreted ookinete protein, putative [Plasmodium relictum]CRH03058.1 secreted ookinete protein, putative [Plasmodium relictum]
MQKVKYEKLKKKMKILCIFLSCLITISIIKNQNINRDSKINEVQKNIINPETNKEGKNEKKKIINVNENKDDTNVKNEEKYKNEGELSNSFDRRYTIDENNVDSTDDNKTKIEPFISIDEKIEEMKKESLNSNISDDITHFIENSQNMENNDFDNSKETKEHLDEISSGDNENHMNDMLLKSEYGEKLYYDNNTAKNIYKNEEIQDNKDMLNFEKKLNSMEIEEEYENKSESENENTNKKDKVNHIKTINKKGKKNKAKRKKEKENSDNEENELKYNMKNDNITNNNSNNDNNKDEKNQKIKMDNDFNKNYEKLKLSKPEFIGTFFEFLGEIILIIKIGIIYRYTHFVIPLKNIIIYNVLTHMEEFFLTILSIHKKSSEKYKDIYGIVLICFFIYFLKVLVSKCFFNRNKNTVDTFKNGSSENAYIENLLKRILFNLEKKKNISNYENILNDILENTDNILVNINIINKENKNIYTDMISNINNIGIFTYISTQALKKINSKSDLIISELTTNRLIDDEIKMDKLKSNILNEYDDNEVNKMKDNFLNEFNENDINKLRCDVINNEFDENGIHDFLKKSGDYEYDDSINKCINNDINNKNVFYFKNSINALNDNKKVNLNNIEDTRKSEYDNFNNNYLRDDTNNKNDNLIRENSDTLNVNESIDNKNNINSYPLNEYKDEEKTGILFSKDLNINEKELVNKKNSIMNKNINVNNNVNSLNNINELNNNFNNINNVYNFNSNVNNVVHTKETHNYENDLITHQDNLQSLNVNCNTAEKNIDDNTIDKIKINPTNPILEENAKNKNEEELNINKNLMNNYANKNEQIKSSDDLINNTNAQFFDSFNKKNSNLTSDNFISKQDYMPNYVQPPYSYVQPSYQVLENSANRNQKYITQRKERQKIVATKSPFKNIP